MNEKDKLRLVKLKKALVEYCDTKKQMPGIGDPETLDTFVRQIIDSLRRVEYALHVRDAKHGDRRKDPGDDMFDPLRAAVLNAREGNTDEAWWLVFLSTHFGRHNVDGWKLVRAIYGKLGAGDRWSWSRTSEDPNAFCQWLSQNEKLLLNSSGKHGRFSSHRKYETLRSSSSNGTDKVVKSYVAWVSPPRTHDGMVREIHKVSGQNPWDTFAGLYKSMNQVHRFGRLGRFDFLAMIGKLGIAPIEPGTTFLKGATGPLMGARLLFGGSKNAALPAAALEEQLFLLGGYLDLGAQVLEDSLCNWQKSPSSYKRFRG